MEQLLHLTVKKKKDLICMINVTTDYMLCYSNTFYVYSAFQGSQRDFPHHQKLNSVQQQATICSFATKNHDYHDDDIVPTFGT